MWFLIMREQWAGVDVQLCGQRNDAGEVVAGDGGVKTELQG
jgi:hypothetical protein